MSSYSEYAKTVKANQKERFYGETKDLSNKYFTFKHFHSDDEVIIITNNVITVKGNPVLIVGSNKAVYLKDFNIRPVHNYYNGLNAYAVKLNRNYFKTYTFKNDFEDFSFDKDFDFDDFVKIAKTQDEANEKISEGHMN